MKKISSRAEGIVSQITISYEGKISEEYNIEADVADTSELIHKGFIGADKIKRGILFISSFAMDAFHMRGVKFPLSIAFIDENGYIIGKKEMIPGNEIYAAPTPIFYALEMPKGFFEDIPLGAKVSWRMKK